MSGGQALRDVGDPLVVAGKQRAAMWTGPIKVLATDSGAGSLSCVMYLERYQSQVI